MEKICIVRRRKDIQRLGGEPEYHSGERMLPNRNLGVVASPALVDDRGAHAMGRVPVDDMTEDRKEAISFSLTPEQSAVIQSSTFSHYLRNGMSRGAAINVQQREDGQISLNFFFDRANALRLLKAHHVCEMLQISKSFLGKLTQTKELKSYKVGGLRRYALEDILEFLSRNEYPGDAAYTQ